MLQQLIQNARRRLLFNEVLKQFAFPSALAIGGLAVLLTVGTRYLEWWVVALFAAVVAGSAFAKLRKRIPGDYTAAVWLDDKAGLHDSLSTAYYFTLRRARLAAISPETEAILLAQRQRAESAAGEVNVTIAVPFRFPRALYGLAALLLVSCGLVGLRYFYGHALNLSAPITEVIFQDFAAKQAREGKFAGSPEKQKALDEARSLLSRLGLGPSLDEKTDEQLDQALADALSSGEKSPSPEEDQNASDQAGAQPGDSSDAEGGTPDASAGGDQAGENDQEGDSGDSGESQGGAQSGDNSESLLSKLKDAMNDMMGAASPPGDEKSPGNQAAKSASQGQASQQPGDAGSEENKSTADGDASGAAQKGKAQGQTGGKAGDDQDGSSVAGAEDGLKAVKAAAQMKVMGKISELIGQRAGRVNGESTVENDSGDQRLQTAYTNKTVTHGEGAGEVSRDEIPMSEKDYVQAYFQQVRKPAGTGSGTSAKPKQAAPAAPADTPK